MKRVIRTLKMLFALLVMLHLVSCNSAKITTSTEETTYIKYDMTYFHTSEYTTMLSLYKVQGDMILDSLNHGYCSLNGRVYVRDGLGKYSGKLFGKFDNMRGWPRIIIRELGIDKQIEDGLIHESIPCGTYDVILIANHYFPIHFKYTFDDRHCYSIDFYLGYTAIH